MPKTSDPTKDQKFQGVVQHFIKTPPKPFTPNAKDKPCRPRRARKGSADKAG